MADKTKIMYGVWRPGIGWLKRNDAGYIAFDHREIAEETADRVGNGAKVYFIDQALAEIEQYFLELEKTKTKRRFW